MQHERLIVDPARPGRDLVTVGRHAACDRRPPRASVSHPYAAIAFCTAGRCDAEHRGRFRVEPGDVLLVPAGMPHRALRADGYECWGLGFPPASFAAADAAVLLAPFDRVRAGASPVVRIPVERRPFLAELFAELQDVVGQVKQPHVQRSLLTLIVHEVTRASRLLDGDEGGAAGDTVAASLAVIERRCLGPLTLGEIAAAVGRSPSYVTTALRRATGRGAVEWITVGRMAEARRLLLHSHEPVDVIGGRVGYADTTHFIRTFRRVHRATPAAWRAAQRAR